MLNKFVIETWVNCLHFLIDEKNLKKLGMTEELISVKSYYMIICCFEIFGVTSG